MTVEPQTLPSAGTHPDDSPRGPYLELDRQAWADLADNTDIDIDDETLDRLRGLGDPTSQEEVMEVYAPLTQLIHLHAQPLRTLRALVRHLSAYLDKHQTPFFFYKVLDDPRRHQLYQRLLQRHAPLVQAYQAQRSPDGAYMLYTRH